MLHGLGNIVNVVSIDIATAPPTLPDPFAILFIAVQDCGHNRANVIVCDGFSAREAPDQVRGGAATLAQCQNGLSGSEILIQFRRNL